MTRPKVLFVGPTRDFAERPFDGLSLRHQRLMDALSPAADVSAIELSSGGENLGRRGVDVTTKRLPSPPMTPASRGSRLSRLALARPRRPPAEWANELRQIAARANPDVVVTFGPWLDEELTPLFRRWSSIHVFDEELSRMPEMAPQSRQARLLRAAELAVRRRRLPVPRAVVVIAPHEVAHARRRFGKAPRVVVVPQTLPAAQWPLRGDRSSGGSVLCVGNLAEPRNADALADVLVELQNRPSRPAELSLVLVSGTGFSPALVAVSEAQPWVRLVDRADDLVPFYRSARLALVPAGRATGFKATILQAWLCGTPVVVSAASAATVAPEHAAAVVEAASPRELAATILDLWRDDAELDRLAGAGRVAARDGHDDARTLAEWRDLVLTAAAEPLR